MCGIGPSGYAHPWNFIHIKYFVSQTPSDESKFWVCVCVCAFRHAEGAYSEIFE